MLLSADQVSLNEQERKHGNHESGSGNHFEPWRDLDRGAFRAADQHAGPRPTFKATPAGPDPKTKRTYGFWELTGKW